MRFLAAIVLLLFALPAHAQSLSWALVVSSCGAPTLTVGGQVQETMDTTGRLCSHKTGSGVSPPVISVAPVASGSLTVGSTLSCTTGTWTNSPTSYAYTWLRGGSTISGATSATYVTVTADGGTSVGCSVIATNAGGNSSPSASNTLAIAASGSGWSAADATAGNATLTNGGLTVNGSATGSWKTIRNTTSKSSGKLYIEFKNTVTMTAQNIAFGFASSGFNPAGLLSSSNYSVGIVLNSGGTLVSTGFSVGFTSFPSATTPALNDVFALAIDFTAGKIWIARNNNWNIQQTNDPATGTNPPVLFTPATVGALFAAVSLDESGTRLGARPTPTDAQPRGAGAGTWTLQPKGSAQTYAPPAGFSAWDGP